MLELYHGGTSVCSVKVRLVLAAMWGDSPRVAEKGADEWPRIKDMLAAA